MNLSLGGLLVEAMEKSGVDELSFFSINATIYPFRYCFAFAGCTCSKVCASYRLCDLNEQGQGVNFRKFADIYGRYYSWESKRNDMRYRLGAVRRYIHHKPNRELVHAIAKELRRRAVEERCGLVDYPFVVSDLDQ